jgi:hypothetical protein
LEESYRPVYTNFKLGQTQMGFDSSNRKPYVKRRHHLNPALKLYGTPIPVVKETKFLGITFDSKISFISHLKYLQDKRLKAMNLLRVIYSTDSGADSATLLTLY